MPPRFSAIKIDGERAYDLAREGEIVELEPRPVEIHRLDLVETPRSPTIAVFEAECGKGTYVRALARDMGRALGCFGHVVALRRTAGRAVQRERRGRASSAAGSDPAARDGAIGSPLLPVAAGLAALPALA